MSNYAEERASELEVLESIFPDELERISDDELAIRVEPEDPNPADPHVLRLRIRYTPTYPDELPEVNIESLEGELDDSDEATLLEGLREVGQETLGMAMVFTLASHLKESLAAVLVAKKAAIEAAEKEKERIAEEAEAARTRGTPVTRESFAAWKKKFDAETSKVKALQEEERLKALPPKEREAQRQWINKLSGRQLFEENRDLDSSDAAFVEEGAVEVDVSQYERERDRRDEEEEERGGVVLSDSD